jgi:hypothetical protein
MGMWEAMGFEASETDCRESVIRTRQGLARQRRRLSPELARWEVGAGVW